MVLEGIVEQGAGGVLIKDSVAASGGFVLHWLLKALVARAAASSDGSRVVFVALGAPFPHYARIARKQGCNLVSCMEKGQLAFIDLFSDPGTWKYSCTAPQDGENPLFLLFKRIKEAVKHTSGMIYIFIDDVALLEVIVQGSRNRVLDFLHYCRALACGKQKGCSVVMLLHEDIYAEDESLAFVLELEHSSNVTVRVEPLSTGHSSDVHGQGSFMIQCVCFADYRGVSRCFLDRASERPETLQSGRKHCRLFLPGRPSEDLKLFTCVELSFVSYSHVNLKSEKHSTSDKGAVGCFSDVNIFAEPGLHLYQVSCLFVYPILKASEQMKASGWTGFVMSTSVGCSRVDWLCCLEAMEEATVMFAGCLLNVRRNSTLQITPEKVIRYGDGSEWNSDVGYDNEKL
ncbi:hypothetical protein SELMODRAFT_417995 [Selaginella moellendorffii]|uniref:Elongator complex protein 6 n=1 Tax=Selaginella moellendorffii TaxID=88036 RepID=D8S4B5_SELML|nr:hypothetical protein SELMODRAFT_417995 [Selaginella moellendorffii]